MKIKKIDKHTLAVFLIMMPFLKPYNVTLISGLDLFFKVWKVAASAFIVYRFFMRKTKLTFGSLLLISFCLVWTVSLVINRGPVKDYGNNILSVIALTLYFESERKNINFLRRLSRILYTVGAVYMVLNLITAIQGYPFFAKGMDLGDNANFLGGDNYSAFILIVLCGLMFYHDIRFLHRIRLKTWAYNIAGLFSLVVPFALTGMISYLFLLFLIYFKANKYLRCFFDWKNIVIICAIFVLAISYFNLSDLFNTALAKLGKSGFNGRNMIWPLAIKGIIDKPILGHGGITSEQASTGILAGANHTHNITLDFLFTTGIAGSAFFLAYIIHLFKSMSQKHRRSTSVLLMTVSAFVFCSIFDFYIGLIYMYLLLEIIRLDRRYCERYWLLA